MAHQDPHQGLHQDPHQGLHQVQGLVALEKGAPLSVQTIQVPDPGPGEALVRVLACGVCHTDLHYRDGAIRDAFPFLLGHEAAGTVQAVGPGVTNVAPGDYVVLAWRAPCGQCRPCRRGRPWYCCASRTADQPMTLADGTPLYPALGVGGFAELTLVAAAQAVPIDRTVRPEPACLIGCAVVTGYGAAVHTGGTGPGDSVAVIGCGGVGVAAVAGTALAGAHTVIAVDIHDRKLDWARHFGATHTVNATGTDPVAEIRRLTGGCGADLVIEAVGHPATYRQAFLARDTNGVLVQAGYPDPTMTIELPLQRMFDLGGALKPSLYGDCLPSRDFPVLVDLYRKRKLDLDAFVSETISLHQVERAFAGMASGGVLRSVVVF